MNETKSNLLLLVVLVLLIATLSVVFFFRTRLQSPVVTPTPLQTQVACTLEAKLCPDGSSVGRQGPSCEFAPCPSVLPSPPVTPSAGMSHFSDSATGVTFDYPPAFDTTYVRPVDWPPKVALNSDAFTCTEAGSATARAGKTEKRTIGTHTYCVTTSTEGAAGSIYTQYAFVTVVDSKTVILTFSTQSPQCANYDDPQKAVCEKEQKAFDINPVVDMIVQTLRISS